MKIFVDTANLTDIEAALRRGFPAGVTTNPTLIAREERGDLIERLREIESQPRERDVEEVAERRVVPERSQPEDRREPVAATA